MAAQEETGRKDEEERNQELAESLNIACDRHGVNLDIWSADSGGGCIATSGLHLHHPGGLPGTLDLPHLCDFLTTSQGCLCQVLEGKGQ